MDRAVDAVNLGAANGDLSLWGLFMQADIVVKLVMLGLLAASVWVWAVVFEKWSTLRRVNKDADGFEDRFWSGGSLDELFDREGTNPNHPMASVFAAAMGEWRRSVRVAGADISHTSVRERIDRAITVTVQREMDRLERWMVFLASVGATAPFIGLFGTVWGIMHSFSAIAAMHNTNLAVVAPGIAEALFATAIGLVAAIPAVLAYNQISTNLSRFAGRMDNFGSEFSAILSRQSEERG
ncbi:protein TolQ [Rhodopila sp.]|uniref:protein TolQ n=1 Tax=Rhodopila sp. TaxID=2480087 RepID=UPI003D0EFE5A